jgi:integrase
MVAVARVDGRHRLVGDGRLVEFANGWLGHLEVRQFSPGTVRGLALRQTIAKLVKRAARTAGIPFDLGTHAGRRTVVTTLFVDGDEALEDIARFVGHARSATTAGYVKRLGRRPEAVARRAAQLLDNGGGTGSTANAHADDTAPEDN